MHADDCVNVAVEIMRTRAVRRVPVIGDGGVVGIVSLADIARHVGSGAAGVLVRPFPPPPTTRRKADTNKPELLGLERARKLSVNATGATIADPTPTNAGIIRKPLLTCMFTLVGWGRFELPTSASRRPISHTSTDVHGQTCRSQRWIRKRWTSVDVLGCAHGVPTGEPRLVRRLPPTRLRGPPRSPLAAVGHHARSHPTPGRGSHPDRRG